MKHQFYFLMKQTLNLFLLKNNMSFALESFQFHIAPFSPTCLSIWANKSGEKLSQVKSYPGEKLSRLKIWAKNSPATNYPAKVKRNESLTERITLRRIIVRPKRVPGKESSGEEYSGRKTLLRSEIF
jgi:hypothetical protein